MRQKPSGRIAMTLLNCEQLRVLQFPHTYCHSPTVVTKVVAPRDQTEVLLKVSPVVCMKACSKYNSCKSSI